MNPTIQKWAKKSAGVFLILIGIPGLFLPFLQGILFIVAGATLLGNERLLGWIKGVVGKSKK